MTTERLLCATDGSPPSEKAVAYTVKLAEEMGRPLTFLLVADGALETQIGQLLDLSGAPAEPGVREQMRGAVVVPVRGGNGREVALPGCRPWRPARASGHRSLQPNSKLEPNRASLKF